jgi:hypothetical protein
VQVARCMTEFLREHQTLGCWVPQDHSGVWRMIMVPHLSTMRACAREREREEGGGEEGGGLGDWREGGWGRALQTVRMLLDVIPMSCVA